MGLLSMLNFLAGAVSTGVYSKIVDQGASFSLSPLHALPDSYVYSNIYLVLGLTIMLAWMMYSIRFGSRQQLGREMTGK